MITHIQGKLVEKTPTHVIIDCNGVGYFVNISLHTFSQIPDVEAVKVFIHSSGKRRFSYLVWIYEFFGTRNF